MKVRLLTYTQGAPGTELEGHSMDELITHHARVSSTRSDKFENSPAFLAKLLMDGHFSPFEMVNVGIQITSTRDIIRQILRHDLHVQEFSQRYTAVPGIERIELRKKEKSRQSSFTEFEGLIEGVSAEEYVNNKAADMLKTYNSLISIGVARETARGILPGATTSTAIFNGVVRNWLAFLHARMHHTAQEEIRDVANEVWTIMEQVVPDVMSILDRRLAYQIPVFHQLILTAYSIDPNDLYATKN